MIFLLDDGIRGFPIGAAPIASDHVADSDLRPQDGAMSLPLLSLDLAAFDANTRTMLDHVKAHGALIAPHAKTPMSVVLAKRLIDAGAWGATVADARQASVLLQGGVRRLLLGNQTGGKAGALRLARLLARYPDAQVHVFVDSVDGLDSLAMAWTAAGNLPPLGIFIEIGGEDGRGGIRNNDDAKALAQRVLDLDHPSLTISGIAAYEGAVLKDEPEADGARVDALVRRAGDLSVWLRDHVGGPLIISAGGSGWFDRVLTVAKPYLSADSELTLMLRSGAIFFHDHGVYKNSIEAMRARGGIGKEEHFLPALRVWVEVLSMPQPDLVICGMGMRDVASDQGLPQPLAIWRDGERLTDGENASLFKLNDQHAFLRLKSGDWHPQLGDVVEFGLSHPCTCIDRHGVIWGLGAEGAVIEVFPTAFG